MDHQLEIAYAVLEVPDPGILGPFFTDVVGLAPSAATAGGLPTWTDDDAVHRVILTEGPAGDLAAVGIEAVDDAAFDATLARLRAAGHQVVEPDATARAERRVARLATVAAPWGAAAEVVTGLERAERAVPTPAVPGGFVTEGQGFGHVVVATTAFDESVRFVTEGLGLVRTDWLETELAPGLELEVRFFHCNARHHSLALARAPFELPQRLHHLMFETNDPDDVGRAFDRALASGLPIPNGLGRHDNDRMFSFYVESPAGFQVEVGHGARRIEAPWLDDRRYERISAWGHQPVAR